MLAYILAIAIGLGSFALYMAAFFFPEVHRKSDFVWSGVGLFYALILWACAGRITGAVLLGQVASVSLLVWFGSEILALRRAATPVAQQTPIPADVKQRLNGFLGRQSSGISPQSTPKINIVKPPEPVSPINPVIPEAPVEHLPEPEPEILSTSPDVTEVWDQKVAEEPPISSTTEAEIILEVSVEETPEIPTVEPTFPSATASVQTPPEAPKKPEETKAVVTPEVTTPKTASQPQKSIPALVGMLSGAIGNLTGLFQKKPKAKTPKPTSDRQPKSPEPNPVPPASTVVESTTSDSQTVMADSEFAEFEDLEATVAPTADIVDQDTSTEPEVTEVIDKPTPSPFEQMAAPQVEVIVEITAEQVNLIVEETQESVIEEISSVIDQVNPENVEEITIVSENETPAETTESEETTHPPLVRPQPPDPDLKAAAQKSTESKSKSKSEPKPE